MQSVTNCDGCEAITVMLSVPFRGGSGVPGTLGVLAALLLACVGLIISPAAVGADQGAAAPAAEQSGGGTRGWLGVVVKDLTPEAEQRLGVRGAQGVAVMGVTAGGPAEAAGVTLDDVIVEFDATPTRDAKTLVSLVRSSPPGKVVSIKVIREKGEVVLSGTVGKEPQVAQRAAAELEAGVKAFNQKDYAAAFKHLEPLAAAGNARAQSLVGWMYLAGQGAPRDDKEALTWTRKAAEQGEGSAQYRLGWMYLNGRAVPKNDNDALIWVRRAVEQGNAAGQDLLGGMYEHGRGVPKDMAEAVRWYRKAAQGGDPDAVKSLERLKQIVRRLDDEEQTRRLAQAGDRAEEAGNFREAVKEYVAALQSAPEGTTVEQELREKIINLVSKLDPPPALPEAAERHMIRAATAAKIAKSDKDIRDAIAELEKALRLAPWLADGYYNVAILKERVSDYLGAIASLKLYLLTPRAAADAPDVRKKIIALEYLAERSGKKPAAGVKPSISGGAVSDSPVAMTGDMWVYKSYNTVNGWGTTRYRVIGTGDNEIRLEHLFFQYENVTTLTKDWNLVSTRGRSGGFTYSPFEPLYRFPLEPGKRWRESYRQEGAGGPFAHELAAEVKGWETVTVPAGTFDALRIDYTNQTTGGITATTTRSLWYSPQVKWVVRDEFYFNSTNYRWKYLYELERYQVQ